MGLSVGRVNVMVGMRRGEYGQRLCVVQVGRLWDRECLHAALRVWDRARKKLYN